MTPRQAEWLTNEADRLGISVSELIRRILDRWIDQGGGT
jgi:hypothetical protein